MTADASKLAVWTFDKQIVSLALADGLHCPEGEPIVSAAVTGAFTVTVEYTDFNKPVSVVAPPASDTVDIQDLMKNLRGAGA